MTTLETTPAKIAEVVEICKGDPKAVEKYYEHIIEYDLARKQNQNGTGLLLVLRLAAASDSQ